jgi:hypothetical protein
MIRAISSVEGKNSEHSPQMNQWSKHPEARFKRAFWFELSLMIHRQALL